MMDQLLRLRAEEVFAQELEWLQHYDTVADRPAQWRLSPRSVRTYLMGGTLKGKEVISPKYIGNVRLVETAIATLMTDRALLLLGAPGTAKTWLSEHLCAAISGDSAYVVQGTAGLGEEGLRYGWNYAKLLSEGPSREALSPSPVMRAMENGKLVRIEELTRLASDVQDSLIMALSEKSIPVPELGIEVRANRGFNVIATANDRDRGVNELSSALRRRFNTVIMPLPETLEEEVKIVQQRLDEATELPRASVPDALEHIRKLILICRELRSGKTKEGLGIKPGSGVMSTAEIIGVVQQGLSQSIAFGNGQLQAKDMAAALQSIVIRDARQDTIVWKEYLETVLRQRDDWKDWYKACKDNL